MSKKEKEELKEEIKEETKEAAEETKAPEKEPEAEKEAAEEKEEAKAEEEKQSEDLQTQYLRLAADFQNFRRRTEKEKQDLYQFANEKIVSDLLAVIDNFERAMDAAPADDKFAEGMGLILKQLLELLKKNNVEEIESLGKPFDPNFHNAVMTEESEDAESGTIIKVFQKGYVLNSKVVRPAMVSVAK